MPETFIAFLIQAELALVTPEALLQQLRQDFGNAVAGASLVEPAGERKMESFLIRLDDNVVSVIFVPRPVPPDTFREALRLDRLWPEAKDAVAAQKAHIIVGALPRASDWAGKVKAASFVTMVSASLIALQPATGVLWATGDTLTEAERFRKEALRLREGIYPVDVWFQYSWLDGPPTPQGEPTLAVITTGLMPFFGREIEFEPAPLPPATIGRRVMGTIAVLLRDGPVIKDGDTIGVSKEEHILVRHRPRGQRPDIPVLSLSIGDSNRKP